MQKAAYELLSLLFMFIKLESFIETINQNEILLIYLNILISTLCI